MTRAPATTTAGFTPIFGTSVPIFGTSVPIFGTSTYEPSRGSSLLSGDRGAPYMLQALAAWRADGWDSNDAPRQLVELAELERALTTQGEAESDRGLK